MSSRLAAAVRVALPDPEIYYSGEDLLAVANKIHAMGPDVDMPDIWDTICTEALRDAEDRPAELDPEGGVCPDCGISHYRGIISNARETVNEDAGRGIGTSTARYRWLNQTRCSSARRPNTAPVWLRSRIGSRAR
jgi:hypothetical protein